MTRDRVRCSFHPFWTSLLGAGPHPIYLRTNSATALHPLRAFPHLFPSSHFLPPISVYRVRGVLCHPDSCATPHFGPSILLKLIVCSHPLCGHRPAIARWWRLCPTSYVLTCPGSHIILGEAGPQENNSLPGNAEFNILRFSCRPEAVPASRECDYHM